MGIIGKRTRSAILRRIKKFIKTSGGIMPLNVYAKFDLKPYSYEDLNGYNWKKYLMTPRSAILSHIKKSEKRPEVILCP